MRKWLTTLVASTTESFMSKRANILNVANFVLHHLLKSQIQVNHLKLQKLLYYIQAWHMVYFGKELIFDEAPEAWVNGPVYRSVYNQYKNLGAYPHITYTNPEKSEEHYDNAVKALDLDKEQWDFLEAILLHYGTMSHEKLVLLTHSEKPWNEARKGLAPFEYSDNKIDLEVIYTYYKERAES
ncbi:MAG: DUF4065 domain-containing protein [Bacteroidetes bacterium]|nr:DUF4065 domain-containing protein [Bacteroidota bacterium]